jgi:flagellar basal body rod protein FlgG
MNELLSASHFSASSQFHAACLEPSLPPSCHHRMQLETNGENGNVHKKLFKKKNREDLSAAKSMQQEILRQSKVNAREEMKEIVRLMRPWTKMKKIERNTEM